MDFGIRLAGLVSVVGLLLTAPAYAACYDVNANSCPYDIYDSGSVFSYYGLSNSGFPMDSATIDDEPGGPGTPDLQCAAICVQNYNATRAFCDGIEPNSTSANGTALVDALPICLATIAETLGICLHKCGFNQ
ncbi:MAG TPA: hypothetical protein PK417_00450 [Hyphomonas sp.]|nr:hypothetical protein [Hyphomonas sp.]HRX73492.1 hypothetical protein [Hyphomonas sp.]